MQNTLEDSETEEVDVRYHEIITEMVDDSSDENEDDRRSKNKRKTQISHHVQRKSWTEEYFGDILVANNDEQSSDALLLESCEGGDSYLGSFRSSDAGDSDPNHAKDDIIDSGFGDLDSIN